MSTNPVKSCLKCNGKSYNPDEVVCSNCGFPLLDIGDIDDAARKPKKDEPNLPLDLTNIDPEIIAEATKMGFDPNCNSESDDTIARIKETVSALAWMAEKSDLPAAGKLAAVNLLNTMLGTAPTGMRTIEARRPEIKHLHRIGKTLLQHIDILVDRRLATDLWMELANYNPSSGLEILDAYHRIRASRPERIVIEMKLIATRMFRDIVYAATGATRPDGESMTIEDVDDNLELVISTLRYIQANGIGGPTTQFGIEALIAALSRFYPEGNAASLSRPSSSTLAIFIDMLMVIVEYIVHDVEDIESEKKKAEIALKSFVIDLVKPAVELI